MKLSLVLVLLFHQVLWALAQPTPAPASMDPPAFAPSEPPTQPVITPTALPSKPTRKPTNAPSKKPTREPTAKPSKKPTPQPTFKPTKTPAAQNPGEYDMCKPKKGINQATCNKLVKTCKEGGIVMNWYGAGCTINGKKAHDGGCQCDGYCGFKCKSACNNSVGKLCEWDEELKACKGKGEYEAYVGEEQCAYQG